MTATNDIRRSFLDFFASKHHSPVASAPLIPHNDPTLMFVNAGMVPFKNMFTGLETPPSPRAVSAQKCVRAGGKHNDLDNVGYTARHHTFFEMLGNFSFGDYFKEAAIAHAWELITRVWGLPADRLLATIYHVDDEAFDLWRRISGLPESRIIRIATNDNFWSMGDTGPCGPCSEIFFDHGDHIAGGPPGSPDEDGDRFVEIWNLVFMQYNQAEDGTRTALPRPSIDTGMGLERIAAVMQGTHDNYATDQFRALIAESVERTGTKAEGEAAASHRVIADHLRAGAFLMADGVLPANDGRGYVLRRIMRRAMRHAHLLGAPEPLMHRLVPRLLEEMGGAYPELRRAQAIMTETFEREETAFRRTLANGLKLLDTEIAGLSSGAALPGRTAFKLYDTYGFPYDLTEDALRSRGLSVDRVEFDAAMAEQKAAARAAWKGSGESASDAIWFDLLDRHGSTEFIGYSRSEGEGIVQALIHDGAVTERVGAGQAAIMLVNQTPCYAESGGQMGDMGRLANRSTGLSAAITDTQKLLGSLHAHHIVVESGELTTGDIVHLAIDTDRRGQLRANHSATHLLHKALRSALGEHVTQKGSLVAADRLRFDFSHPKPLSADELAGIERAVNAQIRGNAPVTTRLMAPDDAVAAGALALFGEKYGDEVRVLAMGEEAGRPYSVELCGGTHVGALGDIGLFVITGESAVSSGIRRIEALTGEAARLWLIGRDRLVQSLAQMVKTAPGELLDRVAAILEERKQLDSALADARQQLALGGGGGGQGASDHPLETIGGVALSARVLHGLEAKALRGLIDQEKQRLGSGIAAFIAVNDGRAAVAVGVTEDLTTNHDAVALVKVAVAALGGQGGGGRPDMAQGGGPDAAAADSALAALRAHLAR